jgi:parallel beta-helix repeat protein
LQCERGNAYVEIKSGGNPILRRNRIRDGKATGVFVLENGKGTLEDNEIFGNAHAGVDIRSGGNPTLFRNEIWPNGREGRKSISVSNGGRGVFKDNELAILSVYEHAHFDGRRWDFDSSMLYVGDACADEMSSFVLAANHSVIFYIDRNYMQENTTLPE